MTDWQRPSDKLLRVADIARGLETHKHPPGINEVGVMFVCTDQEIENTDTWTPVVFGPGVEGTAFWDPDDRSRLRCPYGLDGAVLVCAHLHFAGEIAGDVQLRKRTASTFAPLSVEEESGEERTHVLALYLLCVAGGDKIEVEVRVASSESGPGTVLTNSYVMVRPLMLFDYQEPLLRIPHPISTDVSLDVPPSSPGTEIDVEPEEEE